MPRGTKESEDELEIKIGRRTRASAVSVTDSPLRRSTRKRQTANYDNSSPDSIMSDVPQTRTTRRRTGTLDLATSEPTRNLRSRKNSATSEASEIQESDNEGKKRTTRKSSLASSALDTPTKARLRRTTRAGSESKTMSPVVRVTRRTRANSVDPEGIEGDLQSNSGTPIKGLEKKGLIVIQESEKLSTSTKKVSDNNNDDDDDDAVFIIHESLHTSSNSSTSLDSKINRKFSTSKTDENESVKNSDEDRKESQDSSLEALMEISGHDSERNESPNSAKQKLVNNANDNASKDLPKVLVEKTWINKEKSKESVETAPANKENELGYKFSSGSSKFSKTGRKSYNVVLERVNVETLLNRSLDDSLLSKSNDEKVHSSGDDSFKKNSYASPKDVSIARRESDSQEPEKSTKSSNTSKLIMQDKEEMHDQLPSDKNELFQEDNNKESEDVVDKESNKRRSNLNEKVSSEDNESDINAENLFKDIPAEEWNEKKEKSNSTKNEEQKDSDNECHLVLVGQGGWSADENEDEGDKNKDNSYCDSDDTIIMEKKNNKSSTSFQEEPMDIDEEDNETEVDEMLQTEPDIKTERSHRKSLNSSKRKSWVKENLSDSVIPIEVPEHDQEIEEEKDSKKLSPEKKIVENSSSDESFELHIQKMNSFENNHSLTKSKEHVSSPGLRTQNKSSTSNDSFQNEEEGSSISQEEKNESSNSAELKNSLRRSRANADSRKEEKEENSSSQVRKNEEEKIDEPVKKSTKRISSSRVDTFSEDDQVEQVEADSSVQDTEELNDQVHNNKSKRSMSPMKLRLSPNKSQSKQVQDDESLKNEEETTDETNITESSGSGQEAEADENDSSSKFEEDLDNSEKDTCIIQSQEVSIETKSPLKEGKDKDKSEVIDRKDKSPKKRISSIKVLLSPENQNLMKRKESEKFDQEKKVSHDVDVLEERKKSLSKSKTPLKLQKLDVSSGAQDSESPKMTEKSGDKMETSLSENAENSENEVETSKSESRGHNSMKNSSTIIHVNSDSESAKDSDSSQDDDDDDRKILPSFLYDYDTTDSSESDHGNSDIEREYNLQGIDREFSDDNISGDECRASESEHSDSDDDGEDLGDFIVDDDEETEQEEAEDTGETESEKNKTDDEEGSKMSITNEKNVQQEIKRNEKKTPVKEIDEHSIENSPKSKTKKRRSSIKNEKSFNLSEKENDQNSLEIHKKSSVLDSAVMEVPDKNEEKLKSASFLEKKKRRQTMLDVDPEINEDTQLLMKEKLNDSMPSLKLEKISEPFEIESKRPERQNNKKKSKKQTIVEAESTVTMNEHEHEKKKKKSKIVQDVPAATKQKESFQTNDSMKQKSVKNNLESLEVKKNKTPLSKLETCNKSKEERESASQVQTQPLKAMKNKKEIKKINEKLKIKNSTCNPSVLVKKPLKRLPEDILENFPDIPSRPTKRRKITDNPFVPSRTMYDDEKKKPKNMSIDDDLIPLSRSGGTTSFEVVNLKKKKENKSLAARTFRERMMNRIHRQPVSAFLAYQQKLKASGKNKY